jgi:hypothetical protein
MKLGNAIGASLLAFLMSAAEAQTLKDAGFFLTEGQGYTLCERLVKHVNDKTDNGRAPRLWWQAKPGERIVLPPYPQAQTYLTREITSFPEFERPPFEEIKLDDIRRLIEFIGEVDALDFSTSKQNEYKTTTPELYRYINDRIINKVSPDVLDKVTPFGRRLLQKLERGEARVFRLMESHFIASDALIQIEYKDFRGEPLSIVRQVSSDLREPRPHRSIIDSHQESRGLVNWRKSYYTYISIPNRFQIEAVNIRATPRLCRAQNG